jgi:hypothetical protein
MALVANPLCCIFWVWLAMVMMGSQVRSFWTSFSLSSISKLLSGLLCLLSAILITTLSPCISSVSSKKYYFVQTPLFVVVFQISGVKSVIKQKWPVLGTSFEMFISWHLSFIVYLRADWCLTCIVIADSVPLWQVRCHTTLVLHQHGRWTSKQGQHIFHNLNHHMSARSL